MKKYDKRFIIGYIINKEARLKESDIDKLVKKYRKVIIK
tara:strand:+ start:1323 stop:1439 length:117 start_codon:yes stop_codon:yes gene_type:complete